MKLKYRKDFEGQDVNRWLISYADFMTVLFAFFVVLYAISSVNLAKYKEISKSVSDAFEANQFKSKTKVVATGINGKTQSILGHKPIGDLPNANLTPVNIKTRNQNFLGFSLELEKSMSTPVYLAPDNKWLEFSLGSKLLFESGQAVMRPGATDTIMHLANIIKHTRYPIAIEGYTDNIPIKNDMFASNWELSAARAAAVARVLAHYGVAPNQISATGFGQQFPIADNRSEEGRDKNRRVLIIISNSRENSRVLNPNSSIILKNTVLELEKKPSPAIETQSETQSEMGIFKTQSGSFIFKKVDVPKTEIKEPKKQTETF